MTIRKYVNAITVHLNYRNTTDIFYSVPIYQSRITFPINYYLYIILFIIYSVTTRVVDLTRKLVD